jgi:hypothetical protein
MVAPIHPVTYDLFQRNLPVTDIDSTCLMLWKASSQSNRQARLLNIRFAPLTFGREQSDAFCEALQGMTTFVMESDV